jgi:hypothetical protein
MLKAVFSDETSKLPKVAFSFQERPAFLCLDELAVEMVRYSAVESRPFAQLSTNGNIAATGPSGAIPHWNDVIAYLNASPSSSRLSSASKILERNTSS